MPISSPHAPRISNNSLSMFNLFSRSQGSGARVLSERRLWQFLDEDKRNEDAIEAQGDDHERIDLRLVDKIESYLTPILGDWESSEIWWHDLTVDGNGIRSLLFTEAAFDPKFIDELQRFLTGEHEAFCILCQIFESLGGKDDTRIGTIIVFSDEIVVSKPVARKLALVT